jgi:hypothetical protein
MPKKKPFQKLYKNLIFDFLFDFFSNNQPKKNQSKNTILSYFDVIYMHIR